MAVTDCQGSVIQFTLGGSAVGQTAANGPEYYTMSLMNANATNRQVLRNVALDQYNVSGGFGPTTLTVDTTSAQTLVCQANVTTAGQTTSHQFSRFVLYPTSP
jgi:hypothetical protein